MEIKYVVVDLSEITNICDDPSDYMGRFNFLKKAYTEDGLKVDTGVDINALFMSEDAAALAIHRYENIIKNHPNPFLSSPCFTILKVYK